MNFPQLTGSERSAMLRDLDKAVAMATTATRFEIGRAIILVAKVVMRLLET